MKTQVICENPRFIVNPKIGELLARFHNYYLNGCRTSVSCRFRYLINSYVKDIYECLPSVSVSSMYEHFIMDDETGEVYPIYLQVPCGHCDLCKQRKVNSFVQRCRLECQDYDHPPIFATLTYNNNYLPPDGVSVRDVQLFLKRFRITLERAGNFNKIRYVCVGEYGKTTHRAHYHILLWGLSPTELCSWQDCIDIFESCWYFGHVRSRVVDLSDDKSFYYTSKYLRKDCEVPEGCNPNFVISSRGKGGIGAHFLDRIKDKFQAHPNINFKFHDKWTHKVVPLRFDTYVLNRLLPSLAQSIPSALRTAVQRFEYYFEALQQSQPEKTFLYEDLHNFISTHLSCYAYLPRFSSKDFSLSTLSDERKIFFSLIACEKTLRLYRDSSFNVDRAKSIALKRDCFLARLFEEQKEVDLFALGYSARKRFARSRALEQF